MCRTKRATAFRHYRLRLKGQGVEGISPTKGEEAQVKKAARNSKTKRMKKQIFPRGWNEKRVKDVIAYYDQQTEDEELTEYEAAMKVEGQTMMFVPTQLVPEIRRLIARRGA